MKKILAFILALTTCLSLAFSLTACGGDDGEDDGNNEFQEQIKKPFDYALTEDESAYVVTGYGIQFVSEITIPETHEGLPVIGIARQAFKENLDITKVVIPNSIRYIETEAFYGCTELTSITIGTGVESIGQAAFENCKKITKLTLPEGLTEIGDRAFAGCVGLDSVNIPASVTRVGKKAFMNTKYIRPGAVNYFYGVFYLDGWIIHTDREGFINANLPDNTRGIADGAFFRADSLETVEIPADVKYIGNSAFEACTSLVTVYYPQSYGDWLMIDIADGNENLTGAEIVCNFAP